MNQTWQLQDAKNQFSRVVKDAVEHGPQIVTKRGKEVVVVVDYEQFQQMTNSTKSVWDVFRQSPLVGSGIDLSRSDEPIHEPIHI